jgi:hypothetical protein
VSIRVYAVATPQGYRVLPGGLARIAGESSTKVISNQQGGGSKDVWVLTANGHEHEGDDRRTLPRMSVKHLEVPSSLGESLFWLGRYNERCENKVRLVRATLSVRSGKQVWNSALQSCKQFGLVSDKVDMRATLFDPTHLQGADCNRLTGVQRRCGRLSVEHWRTISLLRRQMHEAASHPMKCARRSTGCCCRWPP